MENITPTNEIRTRVLSQFKEVKSCVKGVKNMLVNHFV